MGIFHYKAEFVKQEGRNAFYTFRPDYFDFENVIGEFKINLDDWQTTITVETKIEDRQSIYCNERPVSALAHKIKKHFNKENELPKTVFFIA